MKVIGPVCLVTTLGVFACGSSDGNTGAPAAGGSSAGGVASPTGGTPSINAGGAGGLASVPTGGISSYGGTPAASGGTPAASGGVPAGTGGAPSCPKSTTLGDQVIFLGDSFLAAPTSEIAFNLEDSWKEAGSSGYSDSPRYYQLVGANFAQIADQYKRAAKENPDIKVIIMDGGGNDVLLNDRSCLVEAPPKNAGCAKTIADALNLGDETMKDAIGDGVEHIVYFFYPHVPTEGFAQGFNSTANETLDFAEPLARKVCESRPECLFVSLSKAAGDTAGSGFKDRGYINMLDVHPTPTGSKVFADAIWDAMKEKCILTP